MLWFSTEQASRAVLTGFAILVMALSLVLTMSRSGITGLAPRRDVQHAASGDQPFDLGEVLRAAP